MKVKNKNEIAEMILYHPIELKRIISIIAHVNHGKSQIADFLLKRAGLISQERSTSLGPAFSLTEEEKEKSNVFGPYQSIVDYFGQGNRVEVSDTLGTGETLQLLREVTGLEDVVRDHLDHSEKEDVAAMELVLEGLHQAKLVAKEELDGVTHYTDMLGGMLDELGIE